MLSSSALNGKTLSSQKEQQQTQNIWEEKDYLGKNSWFITKLFSLHYFELLSRYLHKIDQQNILWYKPQYNSMLKTQYLWKKFTVQRQNFSVMKQFFRSQRGPLILILIISIVIGICSLFAAYYQRFLFTRLQQLQKKEEHPFSTSGWVFFGVIVGALTLKFFLFNFVQGLANQLSVNTRLYLENCLFKLLMKLPLSVNTGNITNNFYVSSNVISHGVRQLPYFLSSIVIILGISGFIIAIVGPVGTTILGFIIVLLGIQFIFLWSMLQLHDEYVHNFDKRTSLTRINGNFVLKLTYNKLIQPFMKKILTLRKKQLNVNLPYNLFDGLIEVVSQFIAVFTIFILYVIQQRHGQGITYSQIFEVSVLFLIFRTPIKMVAYGLASLMQSYAGFHRLQQLFEKCQLTQKQLLQQPYKSERVYNDYPCLNSQLVVEPRQTDQLSVQKKVIELKTSSSIYIRDGIMTMIVGKINSVPQCDDLMKEAQQKVNSKGHSYGKINYETFLIDGTIKQNIIFYTKFSQQKYNKVLNVVHLDTVVRELADGSDTLIEHGHFQTLFESISVKIQLARCLYLDLDYLFINRLIFKQYETIMKNIRDYRNQRNQTTVIVNQSGSYYQIADQIIILNVNAHKRGTYNELIKTSVTLKEFQIQSTDHKDNVVQQLPTRFRAVKFKEEVEQYPTPTPDYIAKFYSLTHVGAPAILVIFLLLPPLLDLYYEVIIAQAFEHQKQVLNVGQTLRHRNTIRAGVTMAAFLVFNMLKVFLLCLYMKISGYYLFKMMMKKLLSSNVQKALDTSIKSLNLDFERNIQNLDTKVTSDFDLAMTLLFEQLSSIVFGAVSSRLFLVIGLPFLAIIILILYLMMRYNRKLFFYKVRRLVNFTVFIHQIIDHRQKFMGFKNDENLFQQFTKYNTQRMTFESNQNYLLQALGIIMEVLFLIILIVTLIVSLVFFHDLRNDAFIELSISFLIGMSNTSRIQLRIMISLDAQLFGIYKMFTMVEEQPLETQNFPKRQPIFEIYFRDFSVKLAGNQLEKLNMVIHRGQRIVAVGSKRSGKRSAFLNLLKIFEKKDVQGDIEVNGLGIYAQSISRKTLAQKIYYIEKTPYFLDKDQTVMNVLKLSTSDLKEQQVENLLKQIWQIMNIPPQFNLDTPIKQMTNACLDIFALIEPFFIKPQVLVIDGGFAHIDIINRQRLTRWLIGKKQMNIIIDLTNRIQVINLYHRKIQFKEGKLVSDQKIKKMEE